MAEYETSSRDYLMRAAKLLSQSDDPALLFYAAFELRCGIEARMQQYAEAWDKIPYLKKRKWEADKLHKNLERAFRLGEKYMRLGLLDPNTKTPLTVHYYTPVTKALRKDAGVLGNYTHAVPYKRSNDPYWYKTRKTLIGIAHRLNVANMGTLLGPVMGSFSDKSLSMIFDMPDQQAQDSIPKQVNQKFIFDISYPDALPAPLEPQAVVWSTDPVTELIGQPD